MTVATEQPKSLRRAARVEWTAMGPIGRTSLIALAMSAVVAVILAVFIPQQVERHLVSGEIRSLTSIAQNFADAGLIPPDPEDPQSITALDEAVRLDLLGSDTVRVKVWAPDGTISYSDVPELINQSFPLSEDRILAFNGEPSVGTPDLDEPETVNEREFPPLLEYYIPAMSDTGAVLAVFEVYRFREHIAATVEDVRGYVWVSVGIAIGLLGTFIVILITVNGRAALRRQALTERLFGELVASQADERARIVGSLHDDIGQSLYRIHYGLEDLRSRVDAGGDLIAQDLDHLGALVQDVDKSLRAELRLLQSDPGEDLSLAEALEELGEVTEMESGLAVSVLYDASCQLSDTGRAALFRAAREAVTNARKHALADSVDISIVRDGNSVTLEVVDDGVGIGADEGLGLKTTRERLEALGGGLRVGSGRKGGTRFRAWVPAAECEDEA